MEGCFRIAVLGTKMVGKTSLIGQLLKKSFPDTYSPTIEALFQFNIQTSENKFAKLEILDTAGSFEFPDLLRKAVRNLANSPCQIWRDEYLLLRFNAWKAHWHSCHQFTLRLCLYKSCFSSRNKSLILIFSK